MIHRSFIARMLALTAALLSSLSSSFGFVVCTQPDGSSEIELVPAGCSSCVACDSDEHGPADHGSIAVEHAPGRASDVSSALPAKFSSHDSCGCSDRPIANSVAGARSARDTNDPADATGPSATDAIPVNDAALACATRAVRSGTRWFVPPRPSHLWAQVRAIVRLN